MPLYSCSVAERVSGVAVDHSGDVFVAGGTASSSYIVEYTHGLNGCKGTTLAPRFEFSGGMALDKNSDLLVCDVSAGTVDVVKPPYTSISSLLAGGLTEPVNVTVNKTNTQAYVTESLLDVQVLSCPSGMSIATLSSANGLSEPAGAVDGKNYVP